jgi:hypothetical protein
MNLKRLSKRVLLLMVLSLAIMTQSFAQDAVPGEILQRTVMLRLGNRFGTGFTVDFQGKLYLITARHVIAGVPDREAMIQFQRGGEWHDLRTVRTLYPESADVDIAVFETDEKVSQPFGIPAAAGQGGVTMGQQVWFLGYPWGIGSHWSTGEAPFIKRGTMSAVDASKPEAILLYIDGFNNPGFSGGPIIYWDFSKHVYQILGVVKGYRDDTAKVLINGEHVDTQILVNSGILVGYSIQHAMKAIEQAQKTP